MDHILLRNSIDFGILNDITHAMFGIYGNSNQSRQHGANMMCSNWNEETIQDTPIYLQPMSKLPINDMCTYMHMNM